MISVYLLLDLCLCPCLCPSLCLSLPPAQTPARPASRPSPVPDLPVRFPCPALPGDGNGRKCRPSVRRGTVGRRNGAEVFPERAAQHHWATETGRSVAQACGAFLVCKLLKKDASLHGSRSALWNVSNRLGWSRRKGMLVYPVLDVVLVSVGGVAGDHLTDESG